MKKLLTILTLATMGTLQAQDYHLSQFFNAEILLNPAKTGQMTQDFRAQAGYRNQWSAVTDAFVTSFASYDMPVGRKRGSENYFGLGGFVLKDKAGKSALGIFEANASAACHIAVNRSNQLSAGIRAGWAQRSINLEGLTWDSQYNGVGYDPLTVSGENVSGNSQSFIESALGLEWIHSKEKHYSIGIAAFHYFQNQSFIDPVNDRLLPRYQLTFEWRRSINSLDFVYDLRGQMQGGLVEVQAGGRMKYRFGWDSKYTDNNTSSAVMLGAYYRYGDAIIPLVGYEFKRMASAWISYDINISQLKAVSSLRGGWEIHLKYFGQLLPSRRRLP